MYVEGWLDLPNVNTTPTLTAERYGIQIAYSVHQYRLIDFTQNITAHSGGEALDGRNYFRITILGGEDRIDVCFIIGGYSTRALCQRSDCSQMPLIIWFEIS